MENQSTFSYIYSYSLPTNARIKIISLEGPHLKPDYDKILADPSVKFSGLYQSACADLIVYCQVFANGVPLCLPVHTSYKAFTTRWCWSEWLSLPIMFSDLPRDAVLAVTVYDCNGPNVMTPVGGTCISLFGKSGLFRRGTLDLRVWPFKEADPETTPGKCCKEGGRMHVLGKLTKKYRKGHLAEVDWLDRLTFREIEVINEGEKKSSPYLYMTVEFPEVVMNDVPYDVMYYEAEGDDILPVRTRGDIVTIPDAEILKENLVENKHHTLARSLRSGHSDKDAKPNANVRDMLKTIVGYPPTKQLTTEEQDLIWKFRFYLRDQNKAAIKFLECVNWKLAGEARQALDTLSQWAPMDIEDALQLLTPSFRHPAVRRYAVSRLQKASDEDLQLFLLQLVQALKYESREDMEAKCKLPTGTSSGTTVTEKDGSDEEDKGWEDEAADSSAEDPDLATFLVKRACRNVNLANFFHWFLAIECEEDNRLTGVVKRDESSARNAYATVMTYFMMRLKGGTKRMRDIKGSLERQRFFVDKLVALVKNVDRESGTRKKKIDYLQALLRKSESSEGFNFTNFEKLPLPLDPAVVVKGVVPEKATLFKSNLMPTKFTFLTDGDAEYVTIFKHGDDLRQDQLVLQIITLMDRLLLRVNLDLKLTPYRVLAVSSKYGFVQYVESTPVAEILTTEGTIQNFFKKHHPSDNGPYGISVEIMDAYVRSCAGYCVITYLLGVGDRHFDNLLLTTGGKLFHIDFGYILGRDPKPFPPPMKLSKEMVEAMGGVNSEHYYEFRKLCYTAFLHLRRHANLFLNLLTLMVDASIPDIALEPDKAVMKVQDKFMLHLGDEEAVHHFQTLLDTSVTAVMAALVEQLHKFAQYWRK